MPAQANCTEKITICAAPNLPPYSCLAHALAPASVPALARDRIEKSQQSPSLLAKPRSLRSRRFANRTARKWLTPFSRFGLTLAPKSSLWLVGIYLAAIDNSSEIERKHNGLQPFMVFLFHRQVQWEGSH
jgi:hypothetical protein